MWSLVERSEKKFNSFEQIYQCIHSTLWFRTSNSLTRWEIGHAFYWKPSCRWFDSAPGYHFFLHAQNYRIFTLTPIIDGLSHSDFAFLKLNLRTFQKTPFVRFGSIAVIQPLRVRASLNVCSTPGVPPTCPSRFHRTPIHTILDEWLGIFEVFPYTKPSIFWVWI